MSGSVDGKISSVPLISVVIPVYNAERTIERTIKSILDNTFTDYEVILVDDGSTDGSAEKLRAIAGTDTRIRAVMAEHGGVGSARNRGLEEARGTYIAFVDADDEISPLYFEKLSSMALENGLDWVYCGSLRRYPFDGKIFELSDGFVFPEDTLLFGDEIEDTLRAVIFCSPKSDVNLASSCMSLLRRSIIAENHLRVRTDLDYGEDMLFNYVFSYFVKSFGYIHDTLYFINIEMSSAQERIGASFKMFDRTIALGEAFAEERERYGGSICSMERRYVFMTTTRALRRSTNGKNLLKRRRDYAIMMDRLRSSKLNYVWKSISPDDLNGKKDRLVLLFLNRKMYIMADLLLYIKRKMWNRMLLKKGRSS